MKKYCFRITKYNPQNRDSNWYYLLDEWTSIHDLGKYNISWTEYRNIESAYVDFVLNLLSHFKYSSLRLFWLEKDFNWGSFQDPLLKWLWSNSSFLFQKITNNKNLEYSIKEIWIIIQFFLREMIWWVLFWNKIEMKVWYDYYLYLMTTDEKIYNYLLSLENHVLFIEELTDDIFILDEDIKEAYSYDLEHLK